MLRLLLQICALKSSQLTRVLEHLDERVLFECATLETWPVIMNNAIDAPSEIGLQPELNRHD